MSIPKRLKTWAAYVEEAHLASKDWRAESWRDEEMYDGNQNTPADIAKFKDIGVDMITVNRTFPVVNMVLGSQAINRYNITAKARTSKDSELSQTMSESAKFVMDQNGGDHLVSDAFRNQIIPGIGHLAVGKNTDPRKEKVAVQHRDWKEMFSDPFASPWAGPGQCKYKFWQKWVDLDSVQAAYPDKKNDLKDMYNDLAGDMKSTHQYGGDEAQQVEDMKRVAVGTPWIDPARKRIRPVEIWYSKAEVGLFAVFYDGRVFEIDDDMDPRQQYEIISAANEIVKAAVHKVYTATFVSRVILKDEARSDLGHDEYPFVPFVGYLDRFGQPYGVPRQIRGQNLEVNKRRSMALAMINTRRTMAESDIADKKEDLDHIHKEINAVDGFAILKKGGLVKIKVDENTNLANSQIAILNQSEHEIQEISGANGEALGYQTNATSGIAKQANAQRSGVVIAPLFDNLRRSKQMLGERIVAGIQNEWTHYKVLRVTDRLTGADKFLEINKKVEGGIQNNIAQGKFDLIVSEVPRTDTVREQNLNLIIEWVKKSPPEIIPHLMNVAFEMADLPNKDQFLEKIKPLLGYDPTEDELTPEERKQKLLEQLEDERVAAAKRAELEQVTLDLEINKKALENAQLEAKIAEIVAKTAKTNAEAKKVDQEAGIRSEEHEMDKTDFVLNSTRKGVEIGEKIYGATV